MGSAKRYSSEQANELQMNALHISVFLGRESRSGRTIRARCGACALDEMDFTHVWPPDSGCYVRRGRSARAHARIHVCFTERDENIAWCTYMTIYDMTPTMGINFIKHEIDR